MSELNVGNYVRTDKGEIGKVTSVAKDNLGFGNMEFCNTEPFVYGDIIKSSPRIIDLIEENDYINGLRVDKNKYGELYTSCVYYGGDIGKQCEVYTIWLKEYTEDMICEVVTHEQFENISYKVGE